MKINSIILLVLILIILYIYSFLYFSILESFDSINIDIGNYLCMYFFNYALSITEQKDFTYEIDNSKEFIKYLPTFIPFNNDLLVEFNNKGITTDKLKSNCDVCLWYCKEQWIIDLWKILKPTIHEILDNAFKQSALYHIGTIPIIHFRCADTPFIKHSQYFFQKYDFFKTALQKYDFTNGDNSVILMSYTKHNSDNKEQEACLQYTNKLQNYINSLGYNCKIQSKTNIEDFADLFYAPFVISTGSSFSFMSGFFGHGKFISTEHCEENTKCVDVDDNIFLQGYNISHSKIDSYYDINSVSKHF